MKTNYNYKKRFISVIIVLALLAMLIPMNVTEASSQLELNKTKAKICVNQVVKLKVTNSSSKVTWKSSNKKIATVSKSGKVTGKKVGTCTITAKVGKKSVKCKVTVRKHSWYTVEETGHFATVVTNQKYIACGCGEVFSTNAEFRVHDAATNYEHSYSTGTRKVKETKWIVDTEEYKICKYCKKEKS
jgi:uncharacterized protein YjdB